MYGISYSCPSDCCWFAGEYNLRLGIMKELQPDLVATYQGVAYFPLHKACKQRYLALCHVRVEHVTSRSHITPQAQASNFVYNLVQFCVQFCVQFGYHFRVSILATLTISSVTLQYKHAAKFGSRHAGLMVVPTAACLPSTARSNQPWQCAAWPSSCGLSFVAS